MVTEDLEHKVKAAPKEGKLRIKVGTQLPNKQFVYTK